VDLLSDREVEILQLVGQGRSSREIADQLHLSTKTVESHRLRMKDKLGLSTAAELVRFAVSWVSEQEG
jgi:DNA-binding CsgD family transcriptional regulator